MCRSVPEPSHDVARRTAPHAIRRHAQDKKNPRLALATRGFFVAMAKPRRASPRQSELLGGLVVRLLVAFRALGLLALLGLLLLLRIASGLASGGVSSAGNRPGGREHHSESEEDRANEHWVTPDFGLTRLTGKANRGSRTMQWTCQLGRPDTL